MCLCKLKNVDVYAWVKSLCTHGLSMHTQANIHVRISTDREVFFGIFNHLLIKTHSKHVSTPPKVSGFHLDRPTTKSKHLYVQKQIKMEYQSKMRK